MPMDSEWQPTKPKMLSDPLIWIVLGCFALLLNGGVAHNFWYHWFPDNTSADHQLNLANDLNLKREFQQAEAEYAAALAFSPNRSDIHYRFARNLSREGKLNEAIEEMRSAALLSPNEEKMQAQLGDMLSSAQQTDEAATQFAKCATMYPTHSSLYLSKQASAIKNSGKPEKALPIFLQCTNLKPKDEFAWTQSIGCFA